MRTLVISDLHLGANGRPDILRRAQERAALVARLPEFDRLVLLGDTLELRHGPVRDALAAGAPVLAEMARALGGGGEIVVVPGNHDHRLLRGWLERRGNHPHPPPLGLESAVEWDQREPLGSLVEALAPARVRVAYPGVWLREDVYAIHGHYGDRHNTVPI
ncbi:MAG: metallophosphoesterase, partial [Solirubrobacteraceae bacterium]